MHFDQNLSILPSLSLVLLFEFIVFEKQIEESWQSSRILEINNFNSPTILLLSLDTLPNASLIIVSPRGFVFSTLITAKIMP